MQVRKQQLELDMEQQTGSKQEKEYVKAVYCHHAYLTYMQSTSCKMPGWMKLKLESKSLREISITSNIQVGYRKDRGTRDQIINISWIIEKAREFQKKKITYA